MTFEEEDGYFDATIRESMKMFSTGSKNFLHSVMKTLRRSTISAPPSISNWLSGELAEIPVEIYIEMSNHRVLYEKQTMTLCE